ncbi:MAG: hypothetical protein EOO82_00950 [Oxalobacteraceae bacterium]|nr:MAG: hypothetical protein EOO82_00950 [Oxalobacteraceae bacterium]
MRPRDLSGRMRDRGDGFKRETFTLPLEHARTYARAYLDRYPAAAYASKVENWRELPDGQIEFTMRRLSTAD